MASCRLDASCYYLCCSQESLLLMQVLQTIKIVGVDKIAITILSNVVNCLVMWDYNGNKTCLYLQNTEITSFANVWGKPDKILSILRCLWQGTQLFSAFVQQIFGLLSSLLLFLLKLNDNRAVDILSLFLFIIYFNLFRCVRVRPPPSAKI